MMDESEQRMLDAVENNLQDALCELGKAKADLVKAGDEIHRLQNLVIKLVDTIKVLSDATLAI